MKYRAFSINHIQTIENILQNIILNSTHKPTENKIKEDPLKIAKDGLNNIRKSGQQGKKLYELFIGCIFAEFLNNRNKFFRYRVAELESESLGDFVILEEAKDLQYQNKIINNTEILKAKEYKIEYTEVVREEEVENTISKKIFRNADYDNTCLLVGLNYTGNLNIEKLLHWLIKSNQTNFDAIYIMYKPKKPILKYFIAKADFKNNKFYFDNFSLNINVKKILGKI